MISGINSVIVLKKEPDCKPLYITKFLKTKLRSYGDEARDFHSGKILKVGSNYVCWSVIAIDFVLKNI